MASKTAMHAPQSQQVTRRFYRPELDVLRLVAFLAVFALHIVAINGLNPHGSLAAHPLVITILTGLGESGHFGLSLFYLLSSFLITTLLLLERQRTGSIHLKSFYVRRILRIWPLYFVFLFGLYLLGHFWATVHFSWKELLAFCLLSGNWAALMLPQTPFPLVTLWSISVEEQFYLVWPSLVRKMTRDHMAIFCAGLALFSLGSTYVLARLGSTADHIWFNSLAQMVFFATGALLALAFGLREQSKSWLRSGAGILFCLFTWYFAAHLGFSAQPPSPAQWPVVYGLAALGCAALLWAFLHLPLVLIRPELVYFGRISYGLYVFHGLFLTVGEFYERNTLHLHHSYHLPVALLATAGAAALSYRFLEQPFLKLKHRFEFVHSRPVAGSPISSGRAIEISEIRPVDRSSMPSRSVAVQNSPRPAGLPDLAAGRVPDPAPPHPPPSDSPDNPRRG